MTIIVINVTKLDRKKYTYSCYCSNTKEYPTCYWWLLRESLGFTSKSKWSGVVATGLGKETRYVSK